VRDLRVRYTTSRLGYFWSILDPLLMSGIYWFIFTRVFERNAGEKPYTVFLISALLAWMWCNVSISDFTRAFQKDARLVRSTAIPRSIWVLRIVLSKGIEFIASIPVLVLFAIFTGATPNWGLLWFPVGVVMQAVLLVGIGLLLAPLCVLFTDLERGSGLILRAMFFASPIIYGLNDLPPVFREFAEFNPLSGVFTLYRVGLFPAEWDPSAVIIGALISLLLRAAGMLTFRRLESTVLKEL